ncbi:MAG: GDSL-like Lipase/Acylhydrolase family protein [Bacteriophage sp.]|nr:MAG: GDSL-like Lipase/Acylhydrolase family protein [Bacteriophage sp.]
MAEKPTIPDFPTLPDFGKMITQACEVVASVRGIPYDFNGTLSLENKFVVLFKTVKEMFDAQDELVKSYKALYDFVNQYFTNLDIQTEVNKKIEEMKDSGELLNLLKPTVSNEVSAWLTSNITNPSNPPIDKSLTVENAAADSKVVGERLLKDGLSYSKQFSESAFYKGSSISNKTDVNGTSYISFDNYNKAETGTNTHLIGVESRFTIPIDNPKTDTLDVYYLVDARNTGIVGGYSLSLWLSSAYDWNNANVCYGGNIDFKPGKISLNKMTLPKGGSTSDVINAAIVRIDNVSQVPNTVNIKVMLFTDNTLYELWNSIPTVDNTLTINGAAADAKVVGERLLKDGIAYSKQFSNSSYYKGTGISSSTDSNGTSFISFDDYNKGESGTDTHLIGVASSFTDPIINPKTDTLDVYYLIDARNSGIDGGYSLSLWLSSHKDWNNINVCYGGYIDFKPGKISLNKMTLPKGGSTSDVINAAIVRIDNVSQVPNTVNIKVMLFTDSTLYDLWNTINVVDYTTDLCFWGDSLTAGAGGSGTSYPNVCASELGITSFKNCGVGGENANTIACRQGGDSLILKPGNVSEYSLSELTDIYGTQCNPLRQGSGSNSVNPIYINGVKCTLSISQTSTIDPNAKYTITGYNDKLLAETPVKFAGCDIKSKITVIFVGQNGPGLAERLSIIDSMISKINDKYIVMGLSSGSTTSRSDEESQMLSKYGVHYFNTRNMLSKYGMSIMNLTPTTSDVNEMSKGEVPSSLRSDSVHLNANGYTALGKMLAQKIRACGYV